MIEKIWDNINRNEGEMFRQIRGKEFTYSILNNSLKLSTTNRSISKNELAKALLLLPLKNTVAIQHLQAPSYIFALLTDNRILDER